MLSQLLLTIQCLHLAVVYCSDVCPDPLVLRDVSVCTNTCQKFSYKHLLIDIGYPCNVKTRGCYCPDSAPFQSVDADFNTKCMIFDHMEEKCDCPGDQVFNLCANKAFRTCDFPDPSPLSGCAAKCECPASKALWDQGRCVSKTNCVCPNKCSTEGCQQCNKCSCKNGKIKKKSCTNTRCPDLATKSGVEELVKKGCWRMAADLSACIFYSPCVDDFKPNTCNPPTGPFVRFRSFCNQCQKCRCEKNHPLCHGPEDCTDDLHKNIRDGCWNMVKGKCTFVHPCPVKDRDCECSSAPPGTRSCKMCQKCFCAYGKKFCSGSATCPDPASNGCMVRRMYDNVIEKCYYVSPCPPGPKDTEQCGPNSFDLKDFCYLYSSQSDRCEFVSPCPETATCVEGSFVCKNCNECRCTNGLVKCSNKKCGDPVPHGCWVLKGTFGPCQFVSPCPHSAVRDSGAFCLKSPGRRFCQANNCNVCTCDRDGLGTSSCNADPCPQELDRGQWEADQKTGQCVFVHSNSLE